MKISEYLTDYLIKLGVTDAFGIPGGVILDIIYEFHKTQGKITPHLSYHEQGAGFEAVGYAQISGKLGVAYATRGPGFTNLITAIADAYYDSVPVLFITSHSQSLLNPTLRMESNQEIDTVRMIENNTKYAKRIDKAEDFQSILEEACHLALTGRKGPVFLDVANKLWKEEIVIKDIATQQEEHTDIIDDNDVREICNLIIKAKRPIVLIGDGINQSNAEHVFLKFINKAKIPVLSSRYAHDIIGNSRLYFGYIGSFGLRYSNFILSKADLILSLGNRLNFPIKSLSYHDIPKKAKIIRVDIDKSEFNRNIPNTKNYHFNLRDLLKLLSKTPYSYGIHEDWLNTCNEIRMNLWDYDTNEVTNIVDVLLKGAKLNDLPIVNDVGNHEFWISRANVHSRYNGKNLYSKNFASLGCAVPKAIGAYYASKKPIICFTGDQGFQMNIQELQLISSNSLPILIVIMNNYASGMIRDKENKSYGYCIHSTINSGYGIPNIEKIANAYNIKYLDSKRIKINEFYLITKDLKEPIILNLNINESLQLEPYLPIGRKTQDMEPKLELERYKYLDNL